ncbi:hypothetical protein [Lysinibacillus sp. NPDC056185]|uniref:hypothetical protein n=1 Tax=Lysinibacillus sp. NPDC056185 TaxID=3345739 RepID=UPI0039F10EEF
MKKYPFKSRKSIFFFSFIILLLAGYIGFILFGDESIKEETRENFKVSSLPQEDLSLGAGYGMGVNSLIIDQESQENGQILMKNPQDLLEVNFKNRGNSGKYILKVFYDFKETKFSVEKDHYASSYVFDLETGKSIDIIFSLDQNLNKDNKIHKLIVAIYASPEKNAKTIKAMTNSYGMTLPYTIYFEGNKKYNMQKTLTKEYQQPLDKLDLQFQGLMINNDFKKSKEVLFPPYSIKAKKGEYLKLAYYSGKYDIDIQDYLIISMIDWKQVKMNNDDYLLLENDSEKVDYGTFSVKVPNEEGLYEYSAIIIPNSTNVMDEMSFSPLDTAYRFTIEVE